MTIDYSDEALRADAQTSSSAGHARAAGYLLSAPEQAREQCVTEGWIMSAVTGQRYADGVYAAIQRYTIHQDFPYTEANRAMLEREKAAADAGRPRLETFERTFAHLPHAGPSGRIR